MIDLYNKIANLTDEDYENPFDLGRIMDYINSRARDALKRRDKNELIYLKRIIDGWLASINKWKERYRRLLVRINMIESDLDSLSLRIAKITGEVDRIIIKDKLNTNK